MERIIKAEPVKLRVITPEEELRKLEEDTKFLEEELQRNAIELDELLKCNIPMNEDFSMLRRARLRFYDDRIR